jgi:lipopolysaccharide biosynthesis glycosyltransferase
MADCKNILYCLDNNFTECTLASAHSAMLHTADDVKINLLHDELSRDNLSLVKSFASTAGERVQLHTLSDKLPSISGSHITNFALARLLAIPSFPGRVLYLDGDTLIRRDLTPLLRYDLQEAAVGAALCPTHLSWWYKSRSRLRPGYKRNSAVTSQRLSQLGFSTLEHYVNSGVMLVDVDRLNVLKLTDDFRDTEKAASYRWHDQDHINVVCHDNIHILDSTYNSIWGNLALRNNVIPRALRASQREAMTNPVIVHFAGKQKPWRHDKQRIGMKLRQLTTRRIEKKFTQEWLQARDQLYASLRG